MSFAIHSRQQGGCLLAAPEGRIDQTSAESFQQALAPLVAACVEGAPALILDFSGVPYISSVGLRMLMLAARQTAEQKGVLAIAALTPLVKEVFEISRFNLVFKVYESVETAVAAS